MAEALQSQIEPTTSRAGMLRAMFGPWKPRLAFWVPFALAAYQFGCDQFGFPTVPALWGVTGVLIPWWAWFLIALVGFVYALFEYVRRNIRPTADTSIPVTAAEPERLGHQKLAALIARRDFLKPRYERALEIVRARPAALGKWWQQAREKPAGHVMGLSDGLRGSGGATGMEFPTLFNEMGLVVPEPPFALGFHDLSKTAYRDVPPFEQLKVDALITRHENYTAECLQLLSSVGTEIKELERQIAEMGRPQ